MIIEEKVLKANYDETILNILIVEVNWLVAYWSISKEYNNKFIKEYGEKFFEETKEILKIHNLSNNTEEIVELKENTDNYYAKFNYSDSIYQVELLRVGKENNEQYGYRLVSNKIHSPNIKILIDNYSPEEIKFRNINTLKETNKTNFLKEKDFSKNNIIRLYEDTMKPSWNAYKKENGYKEK